MCSCVCVYPVNVAKNAWFAPAKRPRCYPVRVLGFDQPDFQGFTSQSSRIFRQSEHWGLFFQLECWDFTRQSAGVLPAGVLGFYQPECWGFTRRSAGVLPAGVLRFFTSRSAGVYQPECWDFYQPECWGFTSRSAGVLPARVLGSYQPGCWGVLSSRSAGGATSWSAGVLPAIVLDSFTSRSARFFVVLAGVLVLIPI